MNKPRKASAKPLRDFASKVVGETFTRHGFSSAELVTRWPEIVGADIAARSEPVKIQWTRPTPTSVREPQWDQQSGTLVLRVEGPTALEIQHLANLICERVNRFFGWAAVGRVVLRQAPLRRKNRTFGSIADNGAVAQFAAAMPDIGDDALRQALARLGTAVKKH